MNVVQRAATARSIDEQAIFLRLYGRGGMFHYQQYAASGIIPEDVRAHCEAELQYIKEFIG